MRLLAIGDIHGCFRALTTLVDFVGLRDGDVLITLGDYVDRGPDSRSVIDWLIEFSQRRTLVPLRGNHDIMMLNARHDPRAFDDWLANGGDATLRSYAAGDDAGPPTAVPDHHWRFLERELRPWHETERFFFVHASAYHDLALEEQPDYMLYWEKFDDPPPHQSGKVMVCGHTSQKSGMPLSVGHAVCIDTWACGDGWLTCLNPVSGDYWQANQAGRTRQSSLELG